MSPIQWYAAYTCPRHEKRIVERLHFDAIETFLPVYKSMHHWRNRTKHVVELPLFPGYVFVRTSAQQQSKVLSLSGVVNIVGVPGQPIPIADDLIAALRIGCAQSTAEPHPYVRIGTRVRIRRGPLEGCEGILLQKKNGYRFVLSMDLLMRAMSVEVDAADVEAITGRSSVN